MKNSRNANSIETSSNAQLIKVQWDANTLVIFCDLCITKVEAGCQLILLVLEGKVYLQILLRQLEKSIIKDI